MAGDRQKATERANKAGKAYKEFLRREEKSLFFTESQKKQRKESFLESHIGIFDDYIRSLERLQGLVGLNADGRQLANDIAAAYPADSLIGVRLNGEGHIIAGGALKERNSLNDNLAREIDLQGKAFENYQKRSGNEEINDTVRREGALQARAASGVSDRSFSDAQKKAVRDICAYMYRHTKTHKRFVDGIAARPIWEKLLMCYIVENDKLHETLERDVIAAKKYTPSLDRFKEKVKYSKHWYKLGVKDINWNLISDAATTAFRRIETVAGGGQLNKNKKKGSLVLPEKDEDNLLIEEKDSGNKSEVDFDSDLSFSKEDIVAKGSDEPQGIPENAFNESVIIEGLQNRLTLIHDAALETRESIQNGDDVVKIAESLKYLNDNILQQDVNINVIYLQEDLWRELQSGAPGGGTDMKALNTELQYRTKYVGLMRQGLGLGQSVLKSVIAQRVIDQKNALYPGGNVPEGMPKPTGEFAGSKKMTEIGTWAGLAIDAPMLLLNALNTLVQIFGFFKSLKSANTPREIIMSGGEALTSLVSAGKSGISTTTTAASTFSNASWGSTGTSAVAGALKTTAGALGVAAGGLTSAAGIIKLYDTGKKRSMLTNVENEIAAESRKIAANQELTDKQKSEFRGKHQMMMNIIAANRGSVKNKQKSAGLQTLQGGLTAASGTLTLLAGPSLGLTGIAALALSGTALTVGVINSVIKKKGKGNEVKSVIDDYIGMNTLYRDYVNKNRMQQMLSEEAFVKSQGGEEKIRDRIRKDVLGALGYPSLKKFYSEIMYQYAQFLYMETFYKDGRKVKVKEVWDIKNNRILDQTKYSCGKLVQNLGFSLHYGSDIKDPKPGVDEIYRKLIG